MKSSQSAKPENHRRLWTMCVVLSWLIAVFATVILVGEMTIGPQANSSISWLLLGRTDSVD